METYNEILTDVIISVSKIYAVFCGILVFVLVLCLLLKKKFNTKYMTIVVTGFLLCEIASYVIFAVPRIIDLNNKSYVTVENSTLILDPSNNNPKGSNVMFFGHAYIMQNNRTSIRVSGIDYFDLTGINELDSEDYCFDIVYAEHSHQLINIKKQTSDTETPIG